MKIQDLYLMADAVLLTLKITKSGALRVGSQRTFLVDTGEGLPKLSITPSWVSSYFKKSGNFAAIILTGPGGLRFAICCETNKQSMTFCILKEAEYKGVLEGCDTAKSALAVILRDSVSTFHRPPNQVEWKAVEKAA